jgi:hypothetical protein
LPNDWLNNSERIVTLDLCHNSVERVVLEGVSGWLHRKGAAPSDKDMLKKISQENAGTTTISWSVAIPDIYFTGRNLFCSRKKTGAANLIDQQAQPCATSK